MTTSRPPCWLPRIAGLTVAVLLTMAGPSRAQYGGFGWGMFQYRAPSVDMLNSRALIASQASYARQAGMNLQAPQNRFAYRDQAISMQDRYNFQSRQTVDGRVGRPAVARGTLIPSPGTSQPANPAPSPNTTPSVSPSSVPVITRFINAANQVVWPADAPTTGELGPKREISDRATLQVAQEYQSSGSAAMTSVAEARKELIDYGQPALQYIRNNATPAVADAFHTFLLSLYDSLAAAARNDGPPPIPPTDR